MTVGYLYNPNTPVEWIPADAKPSRIAFTESENGIKLNNKFSMFKIGGYHAEAYHCGSCHIIISKTES